jgi:hypothetical protein
MVAVARRHRLPRLQSDHLRVNAVYDGIEITKNVMIPESQYEEPSIRHPCIPALVSIRTNGMLSAVYLDDEPQRAASEIRDIGTDWMLTPKPNTKLIVSESSPKRAFGVRHRLTQSSRFFVWRFGCGFSVRHCERGSRFPRGNATLPSMKTSASWFLLPPSGGGWEGGEVMFERNALAASTPPQPSPIQGRGSGMRRPPE